MVIRSTWFTLFSLCFSVFLIAENSGSFVMGPADFNKDGGAFAATSATGCGTDSLVAIVDGKMTPCADETVKLNNLEGQKNPIHNTVITHLQCFGGMPLMVCNGAPGTFYYLKNLEYEEEKEIDGKTVKVTVPMNIISSPPLNDAQPNGVFDQEAARQEAKKTVQKGRAEKESKKEKKERTEDEQKKYEEQCEKEDEKKIDEEVKKKEKLFKDQCKPSAGIVAFELVSKQSPNNMIFAAVKPRVGSFGESGSGIAVMQYVFKKIETEKSKEKTKKRRSKGDNAKKSDADFDQEDDKNRKYDIVYQFTPIDVQSGVTGGNRAFPLDVDSSELSINGGLESIDPDHIAMHYDDRFGKLYIGLHVKTKNGATANQGARAIVACRLEDNKIVLDDVVQPEVLTEGSSVIGSMGSNQHVSIHHINTLYTSTGLRYLVVVGGNGTPEQTANRVSVFPLVDSYALELKTDGLSDENKKALELEQAKRMQKKLGTVAPRSFSTLPIFANNGRGRFARRKICFDIDNPGEENCMGGEAYSVGGAGLPGSVMKIYAANDVVYALVDSKDHGKPVLFSSTALFDVDGSILSWTPWAPLVSDYFIHHLTMDFAGGQRTLVEKDGKYYVKSSKWIVTPDEDLEDDKKLVDKNTYVNLLLKEFPLEHLGVQKLFDLRCFQEPFLIATGEKKVLFAQSQNKKSINTITHRSYSDAVLNEIAPISHAHIAEYDNQRFLFISGAKGLAVLSNDDDSGFTSDNDICEFIAGKSKSFSFKKIGEFSMVQKILSDGDALYLLSRKELVRFPLSSLNNKLDTSIKRLADAKNIGSTFTDVAISDSFILLGTTKGLFALEEGEALLDGESIASKWQHIILPGQYRTVLKLFTMGPLGRENDFAYNGQVFVLSGNSLSNVSVVHRCVVKSHASSHSIGVVQDKFLNKDNAMYLRFNNLRRSFVTDGNIHISSAGGTSPIIQNCLDSEKGLIPNLTRASNLSFGKDNFIGNINGTVKNSATGSWIIAGEFGILTNQLS